jgi:hypothetical protein
MVPSGVLLLRKEEKITILYFNIFPSFSKEGCPRDSGDGVVELPPKTSLSN